MYNWPLNTWKEKKFNIFSHQGNGNQTTLISHLTQSESRELKSTNADKDTWYKAPLYTVGRNVN
jgi:hypothetical protein